MTVAKANQNKTITSTKPIGDSDGFVPANPSENGGQPQNPAPPKSDRPTRQEPFQEVPDRLKPSGAALEKADRNEKLTNPNYPRKRGGKGSSDVGR
jgi:hypothetical protein